MTCSFRVVAVGWRQTNIFLSLALLAKYLEKCFCYSTFLSFALGWLMVKNFLQQVLKNLFSHKHCDLHIAIPGCQLWRDCWEARKGRKSTKDLFSCKENNRTIFLKSFIWYRGIEKSIRTLLGKESSKMYPNVLGVRRCMKLQNVVHTYFMEVHSWSFCWWVLNFEQLNHKHC